MTQSLIRGAAAALLTGSLAACAGHQQQTVQTAPQPSSAQTAPQPSSAAAAQSEAAAIAQARKDSVNRPYTKADIDFMTGMIAHHGQAITMAKWAPTHGASPSIQTLCARIINAQNDEIHLMQAWLRDRGAPIPQPDPDGMSVSMNGMHMPMMMAGMLTAEQMKHLDAAHGPDFDRLFLTGMIQHHQGATSMVHDLFETYGAGEDELIFKLASDINIDQTTEIARMQRMLFMMSVAGPAQGAASQSSQ
jgi:uncharacterized protein (DUF305 family)